MAKHECNDCQFYDDENCEKFDRSCRSAIRRKCGPQRRYFIAKEEVIKKVVKKAKKKAV